MTAGDVPEHGQRAPGAHEPDGSHPVLQLRFGAAS